MTTDRLVRPPRGRAVAPAGQALDDRIRAAARRLAAAEESRVPCAPVRDLIGSAGIPCAYRVQEQLTARKLRGGRRRVGRKIGLTSPAVQAQLGVDQPDFGTLLDTMAVQQDEPVPARRLLQPRIEAEIAFVLAHDLDDPQPTAAAVRSAVAAARPALEIVDSRIAGWNITIADTVADNASSGLFTLGDAEVPLDSLDPVTVRMTLLEDGRVVSAGDGAACLGDPLNALCWLAGTVARLGDPLRKGEVVLSGALGPMVPVRPGASYRAALSGLGEVRAVFAADRQAAAGASS
jgi:2-keto-4-pentenoate hydratase